MSRLPPPPKGKPLPPDPVDKAPELPPPLPSRPGRGGRLPSPPPKANVQDDLDGETYEEPDVVPPPTRGKPPVQPPPPRPESGEIYDELEGQDDVQSSPTPAEPEQENYDACSFEQNQIEEPQQIYEETDEPEPIQEDTYEFVPEPVKPQSPIPPPPPGPPVLPNRPPPAKAKPPPPIESSPELPSRPSPTSPITKLSKILPGDAAKSAAITLDAIDKGRIGLRKVSSEEKKDVPAPSPDTNTQSEKDTGSVLDRIRKFQDDKESNDTEDDLQNQILNARNSLKSRNQNSKPTLDVPNLNVIPKDASSSNTPLRPVSGTSIKDRIAQMQGNASPSEQGTVQTPQKPLPAVRRAPPEISRKPPPTPAKPQKVASHFSSQQSTLSGFSQATTKTGYFQAHGKPTPPAPVVEPSPAPPPPVQNHIINNNNNNNNNIPDDDDDDDQDIYDEGMSYLDPLQGKEWFHGDLDRKASKQKLHTIGEDGTFLVRKATKYSADQPYTLVVLYQGHEYNLKVRMRPDKQVALGEPKEDEMAFKDVASLIEHHQKQDVILVNRQQNQQHQTILKKFPISITR